MRHVGDASMEDMGTGTRYRHIRGRGRSTGTHQRAYPAEGKESVDCVQCGGRFQVLQSSPR